MKRLMLMTIPIIFFLGIIWAGQIVNVDDVNNLPEVIPTDQVVEPKKPIKIDETGKVVQTKQQPPQQLIPIQMPEMIELKPGEEILYPSGVPAKVFLHPVDKGTLYGYRQEYIKPNPYVPGEMVIQFKENARGMINIGKSNGIAVFNIPEVDRLNREYKVSEITRVIKDEELPPNGIEYRLDLIYLMKLPKELDLEQVSSLYRTLSMVKGASPNYIPQKAGGSRAPSKTYPDDPNFDWAGNIQQSPEAFAVMNWSNVNTDTICILDVQQFNNTHTDLSGNFVAGSGTSWSSTASNQHGTMCMGPASARCNNTTGMTGTAGGWGTTKGLALLVYRFTSHAENISGITWARNNGACVLSQSSLYLNEPAGLEDAFASAFAAGVVTCAAAGNSGSSDILWPACFDCVISVGGTTNTDELVNFSTYGSKIDVVAPADEQWVTDGTGYLLAGGTSFATPRAAATCGLIANRYNVRGQAVKDILFRTIDDVEYLTPWAKGVMGRGRINLYEAWNAFDKNVCVSWIGADRLNNQPLINPYGVFADYDARDSLNFRNSKELIPYTPIIPKVYVQNKGKIGSSFYVTCQIDSAGTNKYSQTQLVTGLQPGKGQIVYFPQFTPQGPSANYTIRAFTSLVGDQNTKNDTIAVTFSTNYTDTIQYDIGNWQIYYIDNWLEWAVRFSPVNPCTLKAVQFYLYTNANQACTIIVYNHDPITNTPSTRNGAVQASTQSTAGWKTISLTTARYFRGDFWVAIKTRGRWTQGASTNYSQVTIDPWNDSKRGMVKIGSKWYNMGEDLLIRGIVRYPAFYTNDYAVVSIDNPLATVAPDTAKIPKDVSVIPKATVMNKGIAAQTNVSVRCLIDSAGTNRYNQSRTISLGPGESGQVVFNTIWIPRWEGGTYNMRVITELSTDNNRTNDTFKLNLYSSSTSEIVYAREDQFVTHLGITSATNDQMAQRFTPASYPCSLVAAYYWPYSQDSIFRPKAWDDDGTGGVPGTVLCSLTTYDPPGQQSYQYCDLPDVQITSGDFYVGLSEIGDNINIGIDTLPPTENRAYCQYGTNPWRNLNDISAWGGDWFIKAVVKYQTVPPANDAAVQSIDYPSGVLKPNFAIIPKVTIKNTGNNTTSNPISVYCRFDTSNVQVYLSGPKTIAAGVLPGETREVTFDPFTPTTVDKYYEDSVWLVMSGDGNANNNFKEDSFLCSSLDIIDYWSAGASLGVIGDNDAYHATRFTPELPCSLYGTWVRMQDTTKQWTAYCTTFVWNNRVDGKLWPGQLVFSEGWRGSDLGLGGYTGAWIRRDITPRRYYNMGENFWIGFFCPITGKHQPDILFCDWSNYGRSFYDDERDSTFWWQLVIIDTIIGTDTITCAAEWMIEALVKYLGGESHIIRGNVINTTTQDSLHFRSYLAKNPEQILTETNQGCALSQIESNKALWQVDCKYFWPNWTHRDRIFTIIDWEANSGMSTHKGYYAAILDTLLVSTNPQTAPTCTLRAIPKPNYKVISWVTGGRHIYDVHWSPPKKDTGIKDTTYVVGYELYRDWDDPLIGSPDKTWIKSGGINDTIIRDTINPPYAGTNTYYAIKICYAGHSFGKNPATIKSRYLSEVLSINQIGIEEEQKEALIPKVFALEMPRPNPFVKQTVIKYAVPKRTSVKINLYDITGRLVEVLVNKEVEPGFYSINLDDRNLASGVYFCRMESDEFDAVKKVILVR